MSEHRDVIEYLSQIGLVFNQVIAHGSYGIVFLVYSIQYQSYFAVKQVPEKMFHEQEVRCLMELDDIRIVYLYKYFKIDDCYYFVMEYCPNDLEHFLNTKKMISEEVQRNIMKEVLLSVKVCHDNHIAHRDIKPSNFLIDKYGRIRLSDFGLSTFQTYDEKCSEYVGTHFFMAPEIYAHKKDGSSYNPILSDIWAIGVTLYFIATRRFPFQSYDFNTLQEQIMSAQYDEKLIPDLRLRFIISNCLQVDPLRRPSISEILLMPYFSKLPQSRSCKVPKGQAIFQPRTKQSIDKSKRNSMFVYRNCIVRSQSNNGNLNMIAAANVDMEDLI
ncbi:CAMK family protein kinase [Trichomonas vaginalis G3]|uniref:CAMK family protein kinase n=1 Tax=Trichomonas vaginalis (strain ATCC PRA-98 / G3) TaxID=412133 RepID=A2FL63_TRIV3|nr:cellular response to bisphenol A [Trichomonas vaginalis G3]EAX94352.1 CAMK family protein kinase [Trichomonas vaginalis G3]KAI5536485.1 cellular response to bisphenol A [Trichomonas vaginalis G3]|eukprot:XP_001307282.1 CAMK family protein kinase [Trichomonas vaginalis G3]